MMLTYVRTMWWQIEKDLLRDLRMPRTWPAMLLLGCVFASCTTMQIVVPPEFKQHVNGGLLWLTVFFAGSVALDRSFASERENGCWQSLILYPLAPSNVFLAKMIANFLAINCLSVVLVAALTLFSNTLLLSQPMPFIAVALLGNLGFAAAGTLVSGLTNGISQKNYLLALLVLPLLAPVLIGASEATHLLLAHRMDVPCWRWVHLLIAFDVLFVIAGMLLFEFVIEE